MTGLSIRLVQNDSAKPTSPTAPEVEIKFTGGAYNSTPDINSLQVFSTGQSTAQS